MRKPRPDTSNLDAFRRTIREAIAEGLPVDMDTKTKCRVYRSAGWQAALSLVGRDKARKGRG